MNNTYALIRNNLVENICASTEDNIGQIAADWDHIERIDTPQEVALGVGIGWGFDGTNFIAPPAPPAPPPPEPEPTKPYANFIDLGPFYDRFGATKMAVLTSQDVGVRAIIADLNIRKWVDLQRADVAQALAYVGSVVASVTPALQTQILTNTVQPEENLALRKLYFS